MDVTQIPFNRFLGIERSDKKDYIFKIQNKPDYLNHLKTIHASVLFALAEATSSECLLASFREYSEKTIPVLRKSKVIFSSPGESAIYSNAGISIEEKERILFDLDEKGRTMIEVPVDLYDNTDIIIFSAVFEWFIVLSKE